jgi:hypothetical protein
LRTFRPTKCRHKKKNVSNIVSEIYDYTELDTALILNEEQNVKVGFGIQTSGMNKSWMPEGDLERPTTARGLRERVK